MPKSTLSYTYCKNLQLAEQHEAHQTSQEDVIIVLENDRGNNADVRKCLSNGTPNKGDDDSEMNKVSVAVESHRSTLFDKLAEICGIKISLAYLYSAGATAAVITLLLLFIQNRNKAKYDIYHKTLEIITTPPQLPGLSVGGNLLITLQDWKSVETLRSNEHIVHFNIGETHQVMQRMQKDVNHENYPTVTKDDGALRIFGRPNFCHHFDYNTPEALNFKNILHLHLSDMGNCHHYIHLILTKWNFPNVRSLKLQRMRIEKEEYVGLTKFIERNNETLQKVEIDESFMCASPICDAGMIDFPNHDFQITITRRRESPKWI